MILFFFARANHEIGDEAMKNFIDSVKEATSLSIFKLNLDR